MRARRFPVISFAMPSRTRRSKATVTVGMDRKIVGNSTNTHQWFLLHVLMNTERRRRWASDFLNTVSILCKESQNLFRGKIRGQRLAKQVVRCRLPLERLERLDTRFERCTFQPRTTS